MYEEYTVHMRMRERLTLYIVHLLSLDNYLLSCCYIIPSIKCNVKITYSTYFPLLYNSIHLPSFFLRFFRQSEGVSSLICSDHLFGGLPLRLVCRFDKQLPRLVSCKHAQIILIMKIHF